MGEVSEGTHESTVVMTGEAISDALERMAREVIECNGVGEESIVLLGILSRGRPLADRLAGRVEEIAGWRPKVGSLATTLYRDDLRSGKGTSRVSSQQTHFDFDVDGLVVILVDDVIYAGRTARAALDEVMDYGRPARVQLACLIDRGLRDLPIQPDYCGRRIDTEPEDHVSVRLNETDGEDVVLLRRGYFEEL